MCNPRNYITSNLLNTKGKDKFNKNFYPKNLLKNITF